MPAPFDDISEKFKLATSIYQVSRKQLREWVRWKDVAKYRFGEADQADYLKSLAEYAESEGLFVLKKDVVKLTADGILFALSTPCRIKSETERIGEAVKRYALSLKAFRIRVTKVTHVAEVAHKFVHALECDLEEEAVSADTPVRFGPRSSDNILISAIAHCPY